MDTDDDLEALTEPETLPNEILQWQPTHRPLADAKLGRAHVAEATGASVLAAFAMGALAVGALAIGVLAIGRLNIGRAHIRRLEIDELVVRRIPAALNLPMIVRQSSCACGRVACEAAGQPILSAVCYCADCQEGGRRIEALPGAPHVLDADGGTPYLTYRKDRFACVSGAELLTGYRLKDEAPTQRLVASCCNTAMFLEFGPGHWVSAYRRRFEGDLPPIEVRNQTKHRTAATPIPGDAPSYAGYPPKLIFRLLGARLAMLVGR